MKEYGVCVKLEIHENEKCNKSLRGALDVKTPFLEYDAPCYVICRRGISNANMQFAHIDKSMHLYTLAKGL